MSDNTKQFAWIMLLQGNLDALRPDFVAGDHLWYPVEGRPDIRVAPDVYVAIGRPKGHRGSYQQWKEDGVAPQVVFEVLSPSNSTREMMRKTRFYERYGAQELIVIDPDDETGWAFVRHPDGDWREVGDLDGWTSPLLGIRFVREDGKLLVFRPDGARFLSFTELQARVSAESQRAEAEAQRAEAESQRAARLAAKLAALGLDPDAP